MKIIFTIELIKKPLSKAGRIGALQRSVGNRNNPLVMNTGMLKIVKRKGK